MTEGEHHTAGEAYVIMILKHSLNKNLTTKNKKRKLEKVVFSFSPADGYSKTLLSPPSPSSPPPSFSLQITPFPS